MKLSNTKSGLTLVGVLISSVILTFAFTAFMNLQAALIQFISQSNDEILAQSLANEGLELVRGVRDANYEQFFSGGPSSGISWDDGLSTGTYFIDLDTNLLDPGLTMPLSSCTTTTLDSTCSLALDSNGLYNGSSSANTQFYRYIEIAPTVGPGPSGLAVTAFVIARYPNSSNKIYRAYTELYNTDI